MGALPRRSLFLLSAVIFCSGLPVEEWKQRAEDDLEDALKVYDNKNVAKNVILFIGDGMDITTITATRIYKGQKKGEVGEMEQLTFQTLPHVALSKTFSDDRQVTDSAASATALMAGTKTVFGTLGVGPGITRRNCSTQHGNEVTSILHWFIEEGKAAGIVTTTRVTHATPAAAYCHSVERNWECDHDQPHDVRGRCKDIASQLVYDNQDINVIMGGGRSKFIPREEHDPEYPEDVGRRSDEKNLIQEWKRIKEEQGVSHAYVWNLEDFKNVDPSSTDYLLGLFEPSHMRYSIDRDKDGSGEPTLADMTEKAISILKRQNKGFFLMVEGGRIDHAHHANLPKHAFEDTIAFDEAVARALAMTSEHDTLIIVTADHAHPFTMGSWASLNNSILGLVDAAGFKTEPTKDGYPYLSLAYANGPGMKTRIDLTGENTEAAGYLFPAYVPMGDDTHGGQDVGVFARGPMAHLVSGVHENHFFAHLMAYASCVGPRKDNCSRPAVGQTLGTISSGHSVQPAAAFLAMALAFLCFSALV